jgi:hypothetical protein
MRPNIATNITERIMAFVIIPSIEQTLHSYIFCKKRDKSRTEKLTLIFEDAARACGKPRTASLARLACPSENN